MLDSLSLEVLEQVWTMDAQGVKREGDRDKARVPERRKGVEIKALANVIHFPNQSYGIIRTS